MMTVEELSGLGRRRWWSAAGVLLLGLVVVWSAVVFAIKTEDAAIETGVQERNRDWHQPPVSQAPARRCRSGPGKKRCQRSVARFDCELDWHAVHAYPAGDFLMGLARQRR